MALKLRYKTKEEVPAEMQSIYVERDGEFALDVDGVVDKAKHDEFRAANVALKKELEDQKKRFEGIDPDEVRKLAEEKQQLEETQQLKLGEVEKVLENRMKTAKNRSAVSCSPQGGCLNRLRITTGESEIWQRQQ